MHDMLTLTVDVQDLSEQVHSARCGSCEGVENACCHEHGQEGGLVLQAVLVGTLGAVEDVAVLLVHTVLLICKKQRGTIIWRGSDLADLACCQVDSVNQIQSVTP